MNRYLCFCVVACSLVISCASAALGAEAITEAKPIPAEIQAIFDKPLYKKAAWGLQVVDLDSGKVIYEREPQRKFLTGSVRKLISVGLALDKLGPDHKFVTPIYRLGSIQNGVLKGRLILVASGDLAMGGRTNPNGTLAISNYDHNEANALGNAELTAPDPLAGFTLLAQQVAAAGIREISGDILIDDRLFVPFNFRGEFNVRPIFVNDDVVDVTIKPGAAGQKPAIDWRPKSAAFAVESALTMATAGSEFEIKLEPENPDCFGKAGCKGVVSGKLPPGFLPPLTGRYPLVRTFRIVEPQNYARTAFIEALQAAGVKVKTQPVSLNAAGRLPPRRFKYRPETKVAELISPPYSEYAKWILKVSYNIGADTSLVLYGLTQGVDSMTSSLAAEAKTLQVEYLIEPTDYEFIDGSGGGRSAAKPAAIVEFLRRMRGKKYFETYRDCLPILATDGSLSFVTDFSKDASLAGAKGNVYAKTGTFLEGGDDGILSLRAQAFAGYINTKGGRHFAYALFVNDVSPVAGLEDVLQVFQDEGVISAIIWREN
jgi:D-alanyl-D-alanine carboxypeptidase